MKIYFVLEYVEGQGGVETVVTNIVKLMEERGIEAVVLLPCPSLNPEWEKNVPHLYYYDETENGGGIDWITHRVKGLNQVLAKIGYPDVIVGTHVPHSSLYSRFCLPVGSTIPIVSWLHNPPRIFYNPEYIRYADYHWCISKEIQQEVEQLIQTKTHVTWVGNPIHLKVQPIPICEENHFIYIGRLENTQKRIDILLGALAQLKVDWSLDIYGEGGDRELISELINRLQLSERVTLKGFVEEPWKQIKTCKTLLLSSDFEGFGMVLIEAIARGIPVISTTSGGPQDIVNQKNGLLVPKGNIEAFRQALEELISKSPKELQELSNEAPHTLEAFASERVVNRMLASLGQETL